MNKIKTLRTLKGYTQKDMAEKLHKSEAAYGRLEKKNVKDISTKDLSDIATVLNCTKEDLLKETSNINIIQRNEQGLGFAENCENYINTPKEFSIFTEHIVTMFFDYQQKADERMQQFIESNNKQILSLFKELMQTIK